MTFDEFVADCRKYTQPERRFEQLIDEYKTDAINEFIEKYEDKYRPFKGLVLANVVFNAQIEKLKKLKGELSNGR